MFAGHKLNRQEDPIAWFVVSGLCLAGIIIIIGFVVWALSGCATLYEPVIADALAQTEKMVMDRVGELIHEAATRPPPPVPPMGSTWTEYGVYAGSVGMGVLAVLVDRRRFHRKKLGELPKPDLRTG